MIITWADNGVIFKALTTWPHVSAELPYFLTEPRYPTWTHVEFPTQSKGIFCDTTQSFIINPLVLSINFAPDMTGHFK